MLLKQIRYFVAVADCGSFTEAAERCYISQSAVSQQVQALERELGVQLIVRENRKFFLTPAGEYLYVHGKVLLEEANALCRETVRMGQNGGPRLRIGYLRCYAGRELYEAVAEFSRGSPEVSINIVNGTHEELYECLRLGNVDLVFSDQRRAFSDEYANLELRQCGCYAELSAHNRLCSRERLTLEDLKQIPCILVSSKEQRDVEQEYYQNTLGFKSGFLFAESLEEARLMVAGNRGFLPVESAGDLPPEETSVRRLPIYRGESQITRNYCAFWRKTEENVSIEKFAEILRELLQR